MKNIILFDPPTIRENLKPLTLTRPIANLRVGIVTLQEKWGYFFDGTFSYLTEPYLVAKYPANNEVDNLYINASILPSTALVQSIKSLKANQVLMADEQVLAIHTNQSLSYDFSLVNFNIEYFNEPLSQIVHLPDLFLNNAQEIKEDFERLTAQRVSAPITDKATVVYNQENVFVGKNVSIKAAIINAENGPVYIDDQAVIQEGAIIIGPAAIGKEAMVAFGAKIRPNTTLGPVCRVGGEVGGTIFQAYANKAHDGYLGNSYIGEWCNLGANTNNSNLKNDYSSVKLYNYASKGLEDSKELFCGTFMGDFTKAGISTMLNTGTVIGVCCNIFGAGFQSKFVPSFSWGGADTQYQNYRFDKALQVIEATMARRDIHLSQEDIKILEYIALHKNKEI